MDATDLKIESIQANALTPEELEALTRLTLRDPWGTTVKTILERIETGVCVVLRLSGPFHAIVVLQFMNTAKGKSLFVSYLFGGGVLKHKALILDILADIARINGCVSITASTTRPGAVKMYRILGFKPMSVTYERSL